MKSCYLLFTILLSPFLMYAQEESTKIAFIADIHFMDIYADYENFDGLPIAGKDKKAKIRTLNAQLHSTRLFNENYFVLKAVLNDIAERGIKLVALPGDYTDDGQPIHLKGLKQILEEYQDKYGISFFITTGNHDPVRPWGIPGGKNDYLGVSGNNQPIFSESGLYAAQAETENVIFESGLQMAGYETILNMLSDFGFFPQENYSYWETPFSPYTPKTYSFQKAKESSKLEKRFYQLNDSLKLPDASYLVEPVEGLWLLAIDGNTYVPQKNGDLSGAGIGYNNTIEYKQFLFQWIRKIAENARKLGKKLVAFSHYPAIDFNEDVSPQLREFLGPDKWQLERVPEEEIAKTLAEAGIKIHFAGHMHINDTGKRDYENGDFLVNIQTPSLAAYIPGYKILSLTLKNAEIETVAINDVPGFNELFPLYQKEHNYLIESEQPVWDEDILNSKNYHDFTEAHLENLVKLRFVPNDWPADFYNFLSALSGKELLLLSQFSGSLSPSKFIENQAHSITTKNLLQAGLKLDSFEDWKGEQMILDFYKIRNADKLALQDIPTARLHQYHIILDAFQNNYDLKDAENENAHKLYLFMSIFKSFLTGLPASHFKIDLETGEITNLEN